MVPAIFTRLGLYADLGLALQVVAIGGDLTRRSAEILETDLGCRAILISGALDSKTVAPSAVAVDASTRLAISAVNTGRIAWSGSAQPVSANRRSAIHPGFAIRAEQAPGAVGAAAVLGYFPPVDAVVVARLTTRRAAARVTNVGLAFPIVDARLADLAAGRGRTGPTRATFA
jgi:hypothetical protein